MNQTRYKGFISPCFFFALITQFPTLITNFLITFSTLITKHWNVILIGILIFRIHCKCYKIDFISANETRRHLFGKLVLGYLAGNLWLKTEARV